MDGRPCKKPSFSVEAGQRVEILENPLTRYVSRGGLKLEAALREFNVDPTGLVCADIGASTGGFTHCLLLHGAAKVYAVDSGTDQLHPSLQKDPRVISMENVNARYLDETTLPPVDLAVMDVSFISQTLLFPALSKILKPDGILLSLIKPQFEAGREHLSSGGIVKGEKARLEAIEKVILAAKEHGLTPLKTHPSPITGGDGNVEYLAHFILEPSERSNQ